MGVPGGPVGGSSVGGGVAAVVGVGACLGPEEALTGAGRPCSSLKGRVKAEPRSGGPSAREMAAVNRAATSTMARNIARAAAETRAAGA